VWKCNKKKKKYQQQSFYSLGTKNLFHQFLAKGVLVYSPSKQKAILFLTVSFAIMGNTFPVLEREKPRA
jgi:hypothetical protein